MRFRRTLATACAALIGMAAPASANFVTYQFNNVGGSADVATYHYPAAIGVTGHFTLDTATNTVLEYVLFNGDNYQFRVDVTFDGGSQSVGTPLYNDFTDTLRFAAGYDIASITFDGNLDTIGMHTISAMLFNDGSNPPYAVRNLIGNVSVTADVGTVPEPASLALLGAGVAALGLVRRRRGVRLA